jgi:flagellar motor switch protein FliN
MNETATETAIRDSESNRSATGNENTAEGAQAATTGDDAAGNVQVPEFQTLRPQSTTDASMPLNRFFDVPVTLSALLGSTRIPLRKIMELGEGSVLELNKSIDSQVDLVAQGVILARGEVVVVNDSFAIRIKEIVAAPK